MSVIEKIRSKIRHGLALQWLSDRFMQIGIAIKPFYWVKENASDTLPDGLQTENFQEFSFAEVGAEEIQKLAITDGDRIVGLDVLRKNISTPGTKCYALKDQGQIACFTWLNLKECNSTFRQFPMKENEAYLYGLYTMKPYRGRNLAPYIRLKTMQVLKTLGKDTFYSISEYFNGPSIRFKQKLNCEFLELYFAVELFHKYRFARRIK